MTTFSCGLSLPSVGPFSTRRTVERPPLRAQSQPKDDE
jgi:hypothetical protein